MDIVSEDKTDKELNVARNTEIVSPPDIASTEVEPQAPEATRPAGFSPSRSGQWIGELLIKVEI